METKGNETPLGGEWEKGAFERDISFNVLPTLPRSLLPLALVCAFWLYVVSDFCRDRLTAVSRCHRPVHPPRSLAYLMRFANRVLGRFP